MSPKSSPDASLSPVLPLKKLASLLDVADAAYSGVSESAILPDTLAPPVHVTFNEQLLFHLSSPRIYSFSPNEIVSLLESHALTKL